MPRTKRKREPTADELLAGDFERVPSSVEIAPDEDPKAGPPADWYQHLPPFLRVISEPVTAAGNAPMVLAMCETKHLRAWAANPRRNDEAARRLEKLLDHHGYRVPAILDQHGTIAAGHTRRIAALARGIKEVAVLVQWFATEADRAAFAIADNQAATWADWDLPRLKEIVTEIDTGELGLDKLVGFSEVEFGELFNESMPDAATDQDVIPEPPAEPITRSGDLWALGRHRLICGDCTTEGDVRALMAGDVAALVHADPPYGMGKEKDGVVGDNQHGAKLDEFQSRWWRLVRPVVADNGSIYVWGNAEDLWRWWLTSDARSDERLSLRNEIVWDKGDNGPGVGVEAQRRYFSSERCLFFMLGDQGYSANADNYWEGWEPIRAYLCAERIKMGWDVATMKTIVGHSDKSRDHWTSTSQWEMPTREVYEHLREAAKGDAFKREYDDLKREYDDLKREYDSKRAFFDNTHDNMTDVWRFPRVIGDDRFGHATPKPVAMMERVVRSSSRPGDIVLVPFGGTGPEIIACEKTGRAARILEVQPRYCDVIVKRWEQFTGRKADRK